METLFGFGTALRGYTRRQPDGSHHATQWVVAAAFPLIPLRRYQLVAGKAAAATRWSGPTSTTITSKNHKIVTQTRLRMLEVLLTYLTWWVIGPIVVLGPAVADAWPRRDTQVVDTHSHWADAGSLFATFWLFFGAFILCWICNRLRRLPQ